MKKIFLLLIPCLLLLSACNNFGKRVKINDKIEVYIKGDSVTESDAQALGNYIASIDKENSNQKSFQLSKDNGMYIVKMPVDQSRNKIDSTLDDSFNALRTLFQTQVFGGQPVALVLTDKQFNDQKTYKP